MLFKLLYRSMSQVLAKLWTDLATTHISNTKIVGNQTDLTYLRFNARRAVLMAAGEFEIGMLP